MEPEGTWPCSQEPATCPYPEPIHILKPYFRKIHLNVILPSTPMSSQWAPSFRIPNQNAVPLT
jgi:hypothetical protein